jgi:hypothetical protein
LAGEKKKNAKGDHMKTVISLATAAAAAVIACTYRCEGAFITWSNIHPEGPSPITDCLGNPVPGEVTFGTLDFSKGALVQLWKAMNGVSPGGPADIDDPNLPSNAAAYASKDWKIDDVLLDEVHCGYGTFTNPQGTWSQSGGYAASTGNTIYVRAYNLPKAEWVTAPMFTREVGIIDNHDDVVYHTLARDDIPLTFYFDNLRTCWTPEPAPVVLVASGLGIWLARRRRRSGSHVPGRDEA